MARALLDGRRWLLPIWSLVTARYKSAVPACTTPGLFSSHHLLDASTLQAVRLPTSSPEEESWLLYFHALDELDGKFKVCVSP